MARPTPGLHGLISPLLFKACLPRSEAESILAELESYDPSPITREVLTHLIADCGRDPHRLVETKWIEVLICNAAVNRDELEPLFHDYLSARIRNHRAHMLAKRIVRQCLMPSSVQEAADEILLRRRDAGVFEELEHLLTLGTESGREIALLVMSGLMKVEPYRQISR